MIQKLLSSQIDHDAKRLALKLWLALMVTMTISRLFYFFDYRLVLLNEPYTISDIFLVFASGMRFDSSASAAFLSPLFLLCLCSHKIINKVFSSKIPRRLLKAYLIFAFNFSWLLLLVDHYYYVFYKDHINMFFWEFFENISNAGLVLDGASDSVPLAQGLSLLGIGFLLNYLFIRWQFTPQQSASAPPTSAEKSKFRQIFTTNRIIWFLLFFTLFRGTLDSRPLSLQDRRLMVTGNAFLNLLHTHPLFPLMRGYKDQVQVAKRQKFLKGGAKDPKMPSHYKAASALIPGSTVEDHGDGSLSIQQHIVPSQEKYLLRRPKHVVVFFLESYSRWVMEVEENGFGADMTKTIRTLAKSSAHFNSHFSPAAGTIKNIANAIYSFPQDQNFRPSIVYHKEGYKNFPSRMPLVMKDMGYETNFYYGGVTPWHKLYYFIPQVGFDHLYGENNFPDTPKHRHGLHDEDLFMKVADALEGADKPTFSFVMSLSNHPPYNIPDSERDKPLILPESLKKYLIKDEKNVIERFRAYRYADRSLGKFFERIKKHPVYSDTLFVITGDHTFSDGLGFPDSFKWKLEQNFLLLYNPTLMRPEYVGKKYDHYTSHLDMVPTLAALLTQKPKKIHTWGKNLFDTSHGTSIGMTHFFTCKKDLCLKGNSLYRLEQSKELTKLPASPRSKKVRGQIKKMNKAYYSSAMHYLFRFDPSRTTE